VRTKARAHQSRGDTYAGISDAAVRKATGRGWVDWFKVLRAFNVNKNGHTAAAKHLHEVHACSGWWSQMVVVAFEQATGLRDAHQKRDGYSASASRTIAVSLPRLYKAWQSNARAAWLPDPNVVVRKSTPNKSMRISWADSQTSVEVNFYDKTGKAGTPKSQVVIQHNKLATAAHGRQMKVYWSTALDALRAQLEA
jgi:hypothetical protein